MPGSPSRAERSRKSFPGMCGKPRKFTELANRSRQVSKRLSQPAVTVKASPGAIGWLKGRQSVSAPAAPCFWWKRTSTAAPVFAPFVNETRPPVNHPSA